MESQRQMVKEETKMKVFVSCVNWVSNAFIILFWKKRIKIEGED
jgi:hypothetical protein